jgi:hypothetical protein
LLLLTRDLGVLAGLGRGQRMTVKRLIELKTSSVNYTAEEVLAVYDELRPLAQKLVDRFGQTQAFEILSALADALCPDGKAKVPAFLFIRENRAAS